MARSKGGLFARLSLDYADHPKIQCLSDGAFRAHVEMILYARRYETDGRIPKRFAKRFGSESLSELLTNDEANPSLEEDEAGDYWLYGFADMQETRDEIEARRLVNAENGRRGGLAKKRTAKRTASESLSEKEAETETESETDISSSSPTADAAADREDVQSLCQHLADRIVSNGSKQPTIGKGWIDAARLLLDRDGRELDEAHRLIDWCQDDAFWRTNVLGMPKFREKYDALRLKAGAAVVQVATNDDLPPEWKERPKSDPYEGMDLTNWSPDDA